MNWIIDSSGRQGTRRIKVIKREIIRSEYYTKNVQSACLSTSKKIRELVKTRENKDQE